MQVDAIEIEPPHARAFARGLVRGGAPARDPIARAAMRPGDGRSRRAGTSQQTKACSDQRRGRRARCPAQCCRRSVGTELPEGNSWKRTTCHLGGSGKRPATATGDCGRGGQAVQCRGPHASHAGSATALGSKRASELSETPALRLGDEKVAEHLDARH